MRTLAKGGSGQAVWWWARPRLRSRNHEVRSQTGQVNGMGRGRELARSWVYGDEVGVAL